MSATPSALPVLEHRIITLRRTWRGTVFSSFLLPVLFLFGFGVSVGGFVDRTGSLGVPYLDFIAPGVLASTALQIAIGEAMWPVLSAFRWTRLYHAMRATPLEPSNIVSGEFWYLMVRVAVPATTFLIAMAAFGAVHSWWAVFAVPAAVLTGAAVAPAVLAYSASISSDNMFAVLQRFAVIPMTLLAGVFFPVQLLPTLVRWIAYASPLWHGTELCRYATLGLPSALPVVGHVAYLGLWAAAGYALARARFTRQLTD